MDSGNIKQQYYTKASGQWKLVAESFHSQADTSKSVVPLYRTDPRVATNYRLMANQGFQSVKVIEDSAGVATILLSGHIGGNQVEQTITLRNDEDHFHIEVKAKLQQPKIEYILSAFTFALPGNPDYTFVPSIKRADDDVVGDRKFFAPAAIVEKDGFMLSLVPDLDLINEDIVYAKGARPQKHPRIFAVPMDSNKISMPTGLDLNLNSGVTNFPLIAYGFMDYWVEQHVYWRHENEEGAQIRDLSDNQLHYGFDLFINGGMEKYRGYQRISAYLWKRYGSQDFKKPRPQAMPFHNYAEICYPASFSYEGYDVIHGLTGPDIRQRKHQPSMATWQQWKQNDIPMGGLRLSAPQWYQFIYNTSWWNNVSDATGIYYWGKKLNDPNLLDKARRIVNFALSAPNEDRIFPALYDINTHHWTRGMWSPPEFNYNPDSSAAYWDWKTGAYQTSSASTTAAYLLQFRTNCEDVPGIVPFVRRYGDFIVDNLDSKGCLPAWFNEHLQPLPALAWNAEGGIHLWVLSELYAATKDKKYLTAAEKMARFITQEVLPKQKWYDFETFYSCAIKPESFFDPRTGQYPANTMSVCWAMQGFSSLYEVTHEKAYLETAEAIADYSLFYQAVWAPHYIITAYPFGGFSSQNSDAEWLDQRSHLFADPLVKIGLMSSRQDLLERGVAAARASLTLTNQTAHVENDIYKYPNFPLGLGPENIDHEGFPQLPLRSGPSWCEVGGLMAAADVLRELGGVYINIDDMIAVGVDGISVEKFKVEGSTINISLRSLLATLKAPYQKPYSIGMRLSGLKERSYKVKINDVDTTIQGKDGLVNLPLRILPDGKISFDTVN
jgi:hypothetical protein